jgi:bacterioferritin
MLRGGVVLCETSWTKERIMEGNAKLIEMLNFLLADELTAISQYVVHYEMCANWGYEHLHKKIEARAIQEMKHAELLIGRIIFLEGTPRVDRLNKISIGPDVPKQLANDLKAEQGAWKAYNDAVHLANEVGDAPTRNMLEGTAREEDAHIDWLEEQQDQIKQTSVQLYLANQTKA